MLIYQEMVNIIDAFLCRYVMIMYSVTCVMLCSTCITVCNMLWHAFSMCYSVQHMLKQRQLAWRCCNQAAQHGSRNGQRSSAKGFQT